MNEKDLRHSIYLLPVLVLMLTLMLAACSSGGKSADTGNASCLLSDGSIVVQTSPAAQVPSCAQLAVVLAQLDADTYWQPVASVADGLNSDEAYPGQAYQECSIAGLTVWDTGGDISSGDANQLCATVQAAGSVTG